MAKVTLKGLTKVYGKNTVVDHIELTVENGTLVSILGPSGCGKTTTLRMLAGFENPDDGEVLFDDEPVGKVPVNKRGIGMVFQSYALFPHMTVFQNVAYGLEQRKIDKAEIETRVMDALRTVHMEEYKDRKPKQLSGGQQQRVALARALVIKPNVLLLDESLSALDKKLRVEMQTELRRILEETHVTTFFVTHDQEEAMTLSDTIVVMHDGKIEQTGTPRGVYERPKNKFVADFLGKANFFEGTVEEATDDTLTLDIDGQKVTIPAKGAEAGEKVIYAVRPEKIQVFDAKDRPEGKAGLEGTADRFVYKGNIISCTVDSGSLSVLTEMSGASRKESIDRGEEVFITWSPEDAIRLED
ncbi:MAG: ABC transporter ATP-binding protein [Anaerovoracaceae bacterium]|jgi:spermidine/putrescine transport system ATP-binding protein